MEHFTSLLATAHHHPCSLAHSQSVVDTIAFLLPPQSGSIHPVIYYIIAQSPRGPFIKDVRVRTKGGGGVSPKAHIVREVAWIYSYRSSQNADRGGGGDQKSRKFCGRPLFMAPNLNAHWTDFNAFGQKNVHKMQ